MTSRLSFWPSEARSESSTGMINRMAIVPLARQETKKLDARSEPELYDACLERRSVGEECRSGIEEAELLLKLGEQN